MIQVEIYRDIDHIIGFEIKGHANYASYGEDIVCAAVSALSQTALMALVKVCGIAEDSLSYKIDEDSGFLEVYLPNNLKKDSLESSQIVLKTFEVGIRSIVDSYPTYVTLKVGGGKGD